MSRSWNQVELIGHLTHVPELRKTPSGTSVCGFQVATNRLVKPASGERKEETHFHRIVAWGPLAEQCAKFLKKGSYVFVRGRLSNRSYTTKDTDERRAVTEVVIQDMIMLDKKPGEKGGPSEAAMAVASALNRSVADVDDEAPAEEIPF